MQKQLLTNGNAFKRTDGRWGGVVWYKDEKGERKRKSFSGTTKAEVNKKMTDYITKFEEEIIDAIEGNKTVKDSLLNYLQVFKYPNVEREPMTATSRFTKIKSSLTWVNSLYLT